MVELKRLIDVKSIVTIALTLVVCYLAVMDKVDIKDVYLIIMGFYFGTQSIKPKKEEVINHE